ncbi:MAG TPA: hypothetical protein VFW25_07140 [Silvibacterium sp.]|nr:hypothetical protein [Silvibacterium sp.]
MRSVVSPALIAGLLIFLVGSQTRAQSAREPMPAEWRAASGAGPKVQSSAEARLDLLPLFAKARPDAASYERPDFDSGELNEGYHWKGLLWQSLAFISAENAYRFSTDYYVRHLTATGPYWRDYMISMTHWDMTRWSDGDDFLVDDIGHPMQGAVSAFIEIQNSPTQRNLRIGKSRAYWKSRFDGLLWATAYSTQQKIGPLGEAAIGSAGGYTYPVHCPFPCASRHPSTKYTNNTGWTDFIMTPVGGTVWVIGEDAIDRFLTGPFQEAHPDRLFPKIVRGALNPTRTAANALRGKNPWYRDYLHPESTEPEGVHFESADAEMVRNLPRYEIFPHVNLLSLPVNTTTCTQCRRWTDGGGVGFSARLTRWVDFDSDVDYQPNASPLPSNKAGGDIVMATFGLRSGITTPHYGLKAAVRPGFVSYNHAYMGVPAFPVIPTVVILGFPKLAPGISIGRITHFATALAISGDYGLTRHVAIRGVFGNTPVRYLDGYLVPPGVGKPPYFNWLSHEYFETNENWTYQVGPVLRF